MQQIEAEIEEERKKQEKQGTEHIIDRDVISQFISTVIPRTETCYEWYMDFDLIEKSNDKKKMVWEFTIDYSIS